MYNRRTKRELGGKMKKIKDIWDNNRVLLVLGTIVITCFIIIAVVCFNFFFGNGKTHNIDIIPLKEEDKTTIISKLKENETVKDVQLRTQEKTMYIRIVFENVTLDRAKEIAGTSLEVINDDYKKDYDIHYTIVSEKKENDAGFTMMGAKNKGRTIIIWNNNTPIKESTEE